MDNLEIINHVQSVVVTTEETEDGGARVIISERRDIPLNEFDVGNTVRIGGHEYIILEKNDEECLIIAKNPVIWMGMGNAPSYMLGTICDWLIYQFLPEFTDQIGADNVLPREVSLMADDGTGKENIEELIVSMLTTDEYRKYRELLGNAKTSWWTVSPMSYVIKNHAYSYGYIMPNGLVNWATHDNKFGVRPVFKIKSTANVNL